jgi:hypothetical protein
MPTLPAQALPICEIIVRMKHLAFLIVFAFSAFAQSSLPIRPGGSPALAEACSLTPGLPAQDSNFTLEGKITRLEPGKLTVSTEGNIIFHVRIDDKTEIQREDGTAGSSKDLRVGLIVRVEGDLTESGEILARKLQLQKSQEKNSASRDLGRHVRSRAYRLDA